MQNAAEESGFLDLYNALYLHQGRTYKPSSSTAEEVEQLRTEWKQLINDFPDHEDVANSMGHPLLITRFSS